MEKKFFSQIMRMHSDREAVFRRGDDEDGEHHVAGRSLWKKFFIYRLVRCCFVLSDIIAAMGCLVIGLRTTRRMAFFAFAFARLRLLNFEIVSYLGEGC
jgi:hypothetical protein